MDNIIEKLKDKASFSRLDLYEIMLSQNKETSTSRANHMLDRLIKDGYVKKVGRNMYRAGSNEREYSFPHSEQAKKIAKEIQDAHPYLDFRLFELVQLNEFVNHQLANNIIFVSAEGELEGDVFNSLWDKHQGGVLLKPDKDEIFRYMTDDMIVILKLPTESPKGIEYFWDTRLEKMLVDIAVDKLMRGIVYSGEYPMIFEDAIEKYIIDKNIMKRYATRRGALKKFRTFLKEEAGISEEKFAI